MIYSFPFDRKRWVFEIIESFFLLRLPRTLYSTNNVYSYETSKNQTHAQN
jgi:hypothetical protein